MSRGLGGPAPSLLTVLAHLSDDLDRAVFAPIADPSYRAVSDATVSAHVPMPFRLRFPRFSRVQAAVELARCVRRHRLHVIAIHANGQTEPNYRQ